MEKTKKVSSEMEEMEKERQKKSILYQILRTFSFFSYKEGGERRQK